MPGSGDDVGQDLVLEVDGEEHDQARTEQQPRRQQRSDRRERRDGARTATPVIASTIGYCSEMARLAARAPAAEHHPADHRDVLEPAQLRAAAAAGRRRPHHRRAARQPVDARRSGTSRRSGRTDRRRTARRSLASWRWPRISAAAPAATLAPSTTAPSWHEVVGHARRVHRERGQHAGAHRSGHDEACRPARCRESRRAVSASRSSSARKLLQAEFAARRIHSTSALGSELGPQRARRPHDRPPWSASRPPSSATTRARRATGWPDSNCRAASG